MTDDAPSRPASRTLLSDAAGYPSLEPVHEPHLHAELASWRANVGAPVALDLAPSAGAVTGLDVVCWNVAIGAADLGELLRRIQVGAYGAFGQQTDRPLLLLLQEAYRAGETVPPMLGHPRHHGGKWAGEGRRDIVEMARALGWSLRYAPSMRNGAHQSDRGNAILSNVALTDAHAFMLPYVRERRVVVTARIEGVPGMLFASAHLDVGGRRRGDALTPRYGAGRVAQANELARRLVDPDAGCCAVVGADLNSALGVRDPAVRGLVSAGFHPAKRIGQWNHTFHAGLKLLLDHVLFRSPTRRIREVRLARVDEVPGDRTRRVFGSDHHPLLASVDFNHR